MAITALMPLLIEGEPLTTAEVRGFSRAVVETQRTLLTINPDPHDLLIEGISTSLDAPPEVRSAIWKDLNPFDPREEHYRRITAPNEADDAEAKIAKDLLAWCPLPARRPTSERTALQNAFLRAVRQSLRRFDYGNIPGPRSGDISAAVRRAARVLNSGFPPLFYDAWWSITPAGIRWDDRPFAGAITTAYGLSSCNTDIDSNARSLLAHLDRSTEIQLAYDTLLCAHDLRWLASGAFPSLTRAVAGHRADTTESTLWMTMVVWNELHACAARWHHLDRTHAKVDRRNVGQELGAKRIAEINQQNSDRAGRWRKLALERAVAMRTKHPDRPLSALAQAIAGELTVELRLERALVPATVYAHLRKSDPTLVPTRKAN